MVDNTVFPGNSLNIDPRKIAWRRVMDMNDRFLRNIVVGLGGALNGFPRESGFDIVPSSEIMAILCLSRSYAELKDKIRNILVGFSYDDQPVLARDLKIEGAVTALLKYALLPNLVQTTEGVPAVIHGGPFANIAQGTNRASWRRIWRSAWRTMWSRRRASVSTWGRKSSLISLHPAAI